MDFSEIKGHENIKRAIEIAVLGKHTITILPVKGHGFSMLSQAMDVIYGAIYPNLSALPCERNMDSDIVIAMSPISSDEFFTHRITETSNAVIERINKAKEVKLKSTDLDATCITLAKTAMSRIFLTPKQMGKIFSVAKTIAQLEDDDYIRAHHVAEAIQYQMPITNEDSK